MNKCFQLSAYVILLFQLISCANILGIFPFTARSHYNMYEPLMLELHKRGHNITVLSHFPQKNKMNNFTDISLAGAMRSMDGNLSLDNIKETPFNLYQNLQKLYNEIDDYEPLFSLPKVQELLKSNSTFELIVIEIFNTDMFLGFVHKFKAPFISVSASPLMPWAYNRVANPDNPSYIPVIFTSFHNKMNFISRFQNFIYLYLSKLCYTYILNVKSQNIAMKYFPNLPPLSDIAMNTSLILVNSHFSLHGAAPLSATVKHVGGLHIKKTKKLNKELESFINEAEHGVIVFSMGSMFRSESLSEKLRTAFEKAFIRLHQRIIWKWENENHMDKSGKILYLKWLPQQDILAHKNIKLFIYHGGLLGTMEAVYNGVPILGIPMYGDMPVNLAAVVSAGAGAVLAVQQITDHSVHNAINYLINNSSFKKNAEQLSISFKDRLVPPLDEAVYWTEYVIKYKGAAKLQTSAKNLYWYQYYMIDIILTSLSLILLTAVSTFYFIEFVKKIKNTFKGNKEKIKTF